MAHEASAAGSLVLAMMAMRKEELPVFPWDWTSSALPTANGHFQAYLVDANGRKIAAIWGKGKEKQAIADFILMAVNSYHEGEAREP
jgi:hypothetical protein